MELKCKIECKNCVHCCLDEKNKSFCITEDDKLVLVSPTQYGCERFDPSVTYSAGNTVCSENNREQTSNWYRRLKVGDNWRIPG